MEVFTIGNDGNPAVLPSPLEFAINLERHFNSLFATVPQQTFNTYENLAREYLKMRAAGKSNNEILRALQASGRALGISGDVTTVAATVVSAGKKYVDQGVKSESPGAPTVKEIIEDYTKNIPDVVSKVSSALPWYLNPFLLLAVGTVVYFGPGMLGRYQRGRR